MNEDKKNNRCVFMFIIVTLLLYNEKLKISY